MIRSVNYCRLRRCFFRKRLAKQFGLENRCLSSAFCFTNCILTFRLRQITDPNIGSRKAAALHTLACTEPDCSDIRQALIFLLVFQLCLLYFAEIVRTFMHDNRNNRVKLTVFRCKNDPHFPVVLRCPLILTTHFFALLRRLLQKVCLNSNLAWVKPIVPQYLIRYAGHRPGVMRFIGQTFKEVLKVLHSKLRKRYPKMLFQMV